MVPKPRFTEGEKVLCFYSPLLYEAKCLKFEIKRKKIKYFIHYIGWNKNWDEWVDECQLLKYNNTNLKKLKQLAKTHMKPKKPKSKVSVKKKRFLSSRESIPTPTHLDPRILSLTIEEFFQERFASPCATPKPVVSSSSEPPPENQVEPKKKQQRNLIKECSLMDEINPPLEAQIIIPEPLKSWLVDDWDLIDRQKMILSIPARITVEQVISAYKKEKGEGKRLSPEKEEKIVQFEQNLRFCFNLLLGNNLLHKFERPQFVEILTDYYYTTLSTVYGAIHLVRLFSTLRDSLSSVAADNPEVDMDAIMEYLQDFIWFMAGNPSFFSEFDYIGASARYCRRFQ